jgi:hypothetical protein
VAENLLTFYAVLKSKIDPFAFRRLALDLKAQKAAHDHFMGLYETDWRVANKRSRTYTPSWVLRDDEYFAISNYRLSDGLKRLSINPQHFETFVLPVPEGETLRGVIGCNSSLYLFQVCDSRFFLKPQRVALVFSGENFSLASQSVLTLADSLAGAFENDTLMFLNISWLGRLLDLTEHYAEVSTAEAKQVFSHKKLKLPQGVTIDEFVSLLTPSLRKKVAIVLRSKILDETGVNADSINDYAKEYLGRTFTVKGKFGDRQIELPTDVTELRSLLQCLEEQFFTTGLTKKQRETNSYADLDPSSEKGIGGKK